jgi:sugar phosphate permease
MPLWLSVFENSPFLITSKRIFPLISMNDSEKDYIKLNDDEDLEKSKRNNDDDERSKRNEESKRNNEESKRNNDEIPWRKLISNRIVISVVIAQFCVNWTFYITVAWIPSYFKNDLQFNLKDAGYMSVLPFFLLSIISQSSGFISDYLIKHSILSRSFTRKLFQSIGFISLSTMFCIITFFSELTPLSIVIVFTIGVGFMGASAGGINACYSDISIEYSGAIHALR